MYTKINHVLSLAHMWGAYAIPWCCPASVVRHVSPVSTITLKMEKMQKFGFTAQTKLSNYPEKEVFRGSAITEPNTAEHFGCVRPA